jgi:serine protease inhibitor
MGKLNFIFSLIFLTLATIQCQPSDVPEPANLPDLRPLNAIESQVIQSGNDFAFDIFRKVLASDPSKNIIISPFSVGMAIAMTNNGADATLSAEISTALRMQNQSQSEVNEAYSSLRKRLLEMDRKVEMAIPNSIWYRQEMRVKASFQQAISQYYQAEIKPVDFGNAATLDQINNWVKNSTKGKIEKILDEIKPDHVMFLINAVYFKASWKFPFDKSATKNLPFSAEISGQTSVPTMFTKNARYRYLNHNQVELIDLPYGNGQYHMTILMPPPGVKTEILVQNLSSQSLNSWLSAAADVNYELHLPKFTISYEKKMNDILSNMGMPSAFSGNSGSLSNLFEDVGSYIVDEVKHKAFIDVNEEGTEAAAVTSVGIIRTSLPPSVQINRSFIYLIREDHTQAIVFAGRVEKPE